MISRDRAGDYATAAHLGAPQAIEAADRFHVVKNLAEAVEKALVPCRAELQKGLKAREVAKADILEVPLLSLVMGDGQPYSIPELHRFAKGIEKDKAAVLVGLTLFHNNGQTEGQVTRIKLIKRMMYGRAGFALLRQRVLHKF